MTEQVFRFSDEQREAVTFTLGYSPGPIDTMRVVKKFERYVARYRRTVADHAGRVAWITADQALRMREQANSLAKTLNELERRNLKRIARFLGEEYGAHKSERIERGKEVVAECGTLMDDIRSAADSAFDKATKEALESEEVADQALLALCVDVAGAWHDATDTALPNLKCGIRARRFDDPASRSEDNALWVVLNAIGIDLTDITVQRIIDYTDDELFQRAGSS